MNLMHLCIFAAKLERIMKEQLLGRNLNEIQEVLAPFAVPKFVAKQLVDWIYVKKVRTFDRMSNLSKKMRAILLENFEIGFQAYTDVQVSIDGTKKYLFPTQHGDVEAVYIPDRDRHTLCISSQVGCKMNCKFCMTGKMGFIGQLTATEILNQIYSVDESDLLTNIVYMGMGEPLDNTEAVLKSIELMTAEYALAWSPRRITVSTIGVLDQIDYFLMQTECNLAISLHSPFPEERLQMMPVEKAFHAEDIITFLSDQEFNRQRKLSFEYILFGGLNDTDEHLKGLARLLSGIRCRVNLIRYNAIPGDDFKSSSSERMEYFKDQLNKKGIITTIRKSKGQDIFAACGMLSSKKGGS